MDVKNPYLIETPHFTDPNAEEPEDEFEEDSQDEELENSEEHEEKEILPTPEEIRQNAERIASDIISKAREEAAKIEKRAWEEAEEIRAQAKIETEEERKIVFSTAETEGRDTGYNQGIEEAEAIKEEARNMLEETYKHREIAIIELEPEMVEFLSSVAQKLIGTAARINPQVILHLIREGLAMSAFTGDMSLRVSKDDYENVVAHREDLLELVEGGAELEIIRDLSLNCGDCVIETQYGVIDSSLNMQLEDVKENLSYILRNPNSPNGR